MDDELKARLDFLSEALNDVRGYLEYLAKEQGYGLPQNEVDAAPAHSDKQYWNRLDEAYREDGTPGGVLRQRDQMELFEELGELTDEQKADLAARLATAQAKANLRAKRAQAGAKRKRRRK